MIRKTTEIILFWIKNSNTFHERITTEKSSECSTCKNNNADIIIRILGLSGSQVVLYCKFSGSWVLLCLVYNVSTFLPSLVPRLLGSSAPRLLGSSAPRLLGSSAPRLLGSSAPRLLGSSAPRLPGFSAPQSFIQPSIY